MGTGIRFTLYRSRRKSKLTKTKEHRRMRRQRKKRNLSMKNYKLLKHAASSILFTRPEHRHKRKNLPTSPKTKEHRRMRRQRKKRNLSMKNHKLLKHAVSSILFTRPERKWKNLRTSPVFLLHADLNQRKSLTRNCLEKVTVEMRARIYNE